MLVEAACGLGVVGDAKQKIEATIELAVSKVVNTTHGILPRMSLAPLLTRNEFECPLPKSCRSISQLFDNLRDEVNAITSKILFSSYPCLWVAPVKLHKADQASRRDCA